MQMSLTREITIALLLVVNPWIWKSICSQASVDGGGEYKEYKGTRIQEEMSRDHHKGGRRGKDTKRDKWWTWCSLLLS